MAVKSLFVSATLMLDIDVNDYYSVFQLNLLIQLFCCFVAHSLSSFTEFNK